MIERMGKRIEGVDNEIVTILGTVETWGIIGWISVCVSRHMGSWTKILADSGQRCVYD